MKIRERVFPYASLYLGITAFGLPFLLFTNAGSHLIRADGSPSYSMACTVTGAILNVFLDWLFMFVFRWGIRGAATATIIGQLISFLLCLCYFTRFRTFRIRLNMLGLSVRYVTSIAKLNSILSSFSVGLAQGCQPILGFNMGAKNFERVKKTYKTALKAALCISVMAFFLFQTFPREIVSVFGSGDSLYFEFAERYMRIFMMMVCVFGVQPLSVNYFTGIGNVRQGILISVSRQGLFLIPLLLLLPLAFGIDGVLYAGPIADSMACALSLGLVLRNFRQLSSR